jgi:3-phosphoglycerate kinase
VAFFKQTVKDLPLIRGDHTRVLVRVDYNVPLKDGKVVNYGHSRQADS